MPLIAFQSPKLSGKQRHLRTGRISPHTALILSRDYHFQDFTNVTSRSLCPSQLNEPIKVQEFFGEESELLIYITLRHLSVKPSSQNMAESVTTAEDKNHRPTKKRALSPTSKQAANVEALFANPHAALRDTETKQRELAPPPEIVTNVQGSSAGAGSGEFHVYKASRRREYERLRLMDEESKKEEDDAQYEKQRDEMKRKDEQKTGKNRARREKMKQRKDKKGGVDKEGDSKMDGNKGSKLQANGPGPNGAGGNTANGKDDEEGTPAVEEQGIVINDDD